MKICLVSITGIMQRTCESIPQTVWVQGTSKRGKARLPYVLQQFALWTNRWFCQQPQNSLWQLYRNTLWIAYWVQMCGVMCLGQAISMKSIAIEMLLEPRWITPNQALLLPFLAPLVIWMPIMWQLTWETRQVSGLSVCLYSIYLFSSMGKRSYLHL